ncbi:MAG: hypothetical protein AAF196_12715 [Planctomycetota bacterium]
MIARSLVLALGLTAAGAPAQIDPNVGTPIGGVGDDTVTAVPLSFSVPVPGASPAAQIFVDSNGRLLFATDFSDLSESVAEFLSGVPQFAVYWDDLNPTAQGGDIFFNDLGSSALFTWQDVTLFGSSSTFTFQAEAFSDGVVVMRFDDRMPVFSNDGLTGCTEGGGVADPGATNLSAGAQSLGNPTIYEVFLSANNDLFNGELVFTPDGQGGYDVTSTVADLIPATIDAVIPGCDLPGPTLNFTPNVQGGYDLVVGDGLPDPGFALGTALPIGEDEVRMVAPSRSVTFPGGSVVNEIYIDSNGRVLSASDPSDFIESVGDLLNDPAQVAVLWDDLSPANGGNVWFHETATGLSVTWDGVPEFFSVGSNTAQVFFGDDGSISLSYPSVTALDALVGLSAGGGISDPGESDLSMGGVSSATPILYELFTGDLDLAASVPHLALSGPPTLGSTVTMSITAVSDVPFAQFFLMGLPTSVSVLPFNGPDCSLLCDGSFLTIGLPIGTDLNLNIPMMPALRSVSVRLQGSSFDPGSGFLFWVLFTEAYDVTFGDF